MTSTDDNHGPDGRAETPIGNRAETSAQPPESNYALYIMVAVAWVLVQVLLTLKGGSPVLQGELIDPDAYMRLVRVTALHETGAWFDNTIERLNAPYGATLHWTRPWDVMLLGGALALAPFTGFETALFWSGALLSPIITLCACFLMPWATRPLLDQKARNLSMLLLLVQPGILIYATAGRADHHSLQVLLLIISIGLILRLLTRSGGSTTALAAGAVAGLGLWISIEYLLPLAVTLGALIFCWIRQGSSFSAIGLRFSLGLAWVTALAVLLEYPWSRVFAPEYDRISVAHFAITLIVALFWLLALFMDRSIGSQGAVIRRLLFSAFGGIAAVVLLYLLYPKFFAGPLADMDPGLELWTQNIRELQSLVPTSQDRLGKFLLYVAVPLVCFGYVLYLLWNKRESRSFDAWLFVGLALAVLLVLATRHIRFAPFAELLAVLPAAHLIERFGQLTNKIRMRPMRPLVSALGTAVFVLALPGAGLAIKELSAASSSTARESASGEECHVAEFAAFLNDVDGLGAQSMTLAAGINFGPELIYRTHHAVLAAPYHRNHQGVSDNYRIFDATKDEDARAVLSDRNVDLVLFCGTVIRAHSLLTPHEGAPTLFERLADNDPPDWLEEVPLPAEPATGFRLYRVR